MFILNPSSTETYDSLLLFTYGGPEGMGDVAPFLDHVLAGKRVSPGRRAEVERHYALLDGVSPINRHSRELLSRLREALPKHAIRLPIYWGCRHSRPRVADTLREIVRDGFRRTLVFVPSPFGGYFGDEVYRIALENAVREIGVPAFSWEKLPPFGEHPGFIAAQAEVLAEAITDFSDDSAVLFTAHSIPLSPNADDYARQVETAAKRVWEMVSAKDTWNRSAFLAWQSAGGPPGTWLAPDVATVLARLSALGKKNVFLVPLGFPLENMEVVYDLDREAAETAHRLGITSRRVKTVGTHPEFVEMICEMISERVA